MLSLKSILLQSLFTVINAKYSCNFSFKEKTNKENDFTTITIDTDGFKKYYSETETKKRQADSSNPLLNEFSDLRNYKSDKIFKLSKVGIIADLQSSAFASSFFWRENGVTYRLAMPITCEEFTLEILFINAVLNTDFGIFTAPELSFVETTQVRRGLKMVSETITSSYKLYEGKIFIENIELNQYQGNLSDAFINHLQSLPEFVQYV